MNEATPMRMRFFGGLWLVILFLSVRASAGDDVRIVQTPDLRGDAGLALAVNDLGWALRTVSRESASVFRPPDDRPSQGDMILVGHSAGLAGHRWQPPGAEAFRIQPVSLDNRRALLVQGDGRGLMYGVFKLAERIRVTGRVWDIKHEASPAFPLRMFSEEGQLLVLPDLAYYSVLPPYVNETRVRKEIDQLKRLTDHIVRLGYNALTVLHVNVEEYIDYRYLDQPIYPEGDPHRLRSPVFCAYLTELCDYAHARHVDVYLQPYEFQYPARLAELYKIDLGGPDIERIIEAKCRELFERVPLDGLIITPTETHPRCGYRSVQLWRSQGRPGVGKMATLYHNACKKLGKRSIFRLWGIVKEASHVPDVIACAPNDVEMSIKNTGNDYYAGWPMTDALTSRLPREQPLTVLFDTFREYDGWSRLFVYYKSWRERVRVCRDQGVVGINAWGPWSEKCISSDEEGTVSWAGHWNRFRMFIDGFTPGQANAYLLARLAWDPDADVRAIAQDFAGVHLGAANAQAGADALMATEAAFFEYKLGQRAEVAPPNYIKWTMVFRPVGSLLEKAYRRIPPDEVYRSNARALEHVRKMEEAFAKTDPSQAPDADRYARFKEGIEKTALYLRTLYLWREGWWRHRAKSDLSGEAIAANDAALAKTQVELNELFESWGRFPDEARYWCITFRHGLPECTPEDSFLRWYYKGKRTLESIAKSF